MAVKKFRFRPEGFNDYSDILHPETSADVVLLEDKAGNFSSNNVEGALVELKDDLDAHLADNMMHGNAQKILGYPIEIDNMEFAHGKTLKFDKDRGLWVIEFQGVGYIYNEGEEKFNITLNPRKDYGETAAQKYGDHIYLYAAQHEYAYAMARTELPVDLTNTKVLYFDVENTGSTNNNWTRLFANNRIPGGTASTFDAYYATSMSFSRRVIGIDVSALKGTFYIGVIAKPHSDSATSRVKLYRIWGE